METWDALADRPLRPGTRLKRRSFDDVVHRNGW